MNHHIHAALANEHVAELRRVADARRAAAAAIGTRRRRRFGISASSARLRRVPRPVAPDPSDAR